MIQSLQNRVAESFAILIVLAAIFLYYVIKTKPSNAESHEEQDGGKQKFGGEAMAKGPFFI